MDTKEKVFSILKDLACAEEITEQSSLQEDVGLDSLNMVTLLIELEDAFGITLDESSMNPFDLVTVADVIDLVDRYTGDSHA